MTLFISIRKNSSSLKSITAHAISHKMLCIISEKYDNNIVYNTERMFYCEAKFRKDYEAMLNNACTGKIFFLI